MTPSRQHRVRFHLGAGSPDDKGVDVVWARKKGRTDSQLGHKRALDAGHNVADMMDFLAEEARPGEHAASPPTVPRLLDLWLGGDTPGRACGARATYMKNSRRGRKGRDRPGGLQTESAAMIKSLATLKDLLANLPEPQAKSNPPESGEQDKHDSLTAREGSTDNVAITTMPPNNQEVDSSLKVGQTNDELLLENIDIDLLEDLDLASCIKTPLPPQSTVAPTTPPHANKLRHRPIESTSSTFQHHHSGPPIGQAIGIFLESQHEQETVKGWDAGNPTVPQSNCQPLPFLNNLNRHNSWDPATSGSHSVSSSNHMPLSHQAVLPKHAPDIRVDVRASSIHRSPLSAVANTPTATQACQLLNGRHSPTGTNTKQIPPTKHAGNEGEIVYSQEMQLRIKQKRAAALRRKRIRERMALSQ